MAEEEAVADCGADAPAEPDAPPADAPPADAAPADDAATGEEEEWSLKAEATRIFNLVDHDSDGSLNLNELTSMTGIGRMAERMLGSSDSDFSGCVSLDEWLAYIKLKGTQPQYTATPKYAMGSMDLYSSSSHFTE